MIKFENDGTWTRLDSEEDLLYHYPLHVWGTYRPQPYRKPERYPCLFHEVAVVDRSNGPDYAMLAYIYDFEETTETADK